MCTRIKILPSYLLIDYVNNSFLKRLIYIYFLSLSVLSVCVHVYHMHVWWYINPEEGIRFLGTRITDGFELPCGHWELKPGPL